MESKLATYSTKILDILKDEEEPFNCWACRHMSKDIIYMRTFCGLSNSKATGSHKKVHVSTRINGKSENKPNFCPFVAEIRPSRWDKDV